MRVTILGYPLPIQLLCLISENLETDTKIPERETKEFLHIHMLCREGGRERESEIMAEAEPLTELVQALEQATLMAKQLPTTADPTHLHHIYSSLHHAHHRLSSFLSLPSSPPPQPPPPEPMQVGDEWEDETEVTSKDPIDKVEERMRDCYIQNKRRKRPLSPSSVAEPRKYVAEVAGFDARESRLKALDLVYQFHG